MSKKINIFDTTLRDGLLTPNFHIIWEQKLKIFHTLVELGVDIIEAGATRLMLDRASIQPITPFSWSW